MGWFGVVVSVRACVRVILPFPLYASSVFFRARKTFFFNDNDNENERMRGLQSSKVFKILYFTGNFPLSHL